MITNITAKSTSHSTTHVTASLASQVVLNTNYNRVGASFFNPASSTANAYLSIGTTSSTGSFLVMLPPGSYYSFDTLTVEPVSVIFDSLSGSFMITEEN